jgi:hypothetical protein
MIMSLKMLPWNKLGLPDGRAGTLPSLLDFFRDAWPSLSKYFHPTQRLASSIDCPKPGGDGCPRQVVVHSHNDIVAVCGNSPKECDPIKIARRDIIIHELKVGMLLSDLAHFLHIKGAEPENILPLTWSLGSYTASARPTMAVYISLQPDAEGLQHIAITLLAQKAKPFILLTPSRNSCPVSLAETIQAAGAHLVGIDEFQGHQEPTGYAGLLGEFVISEHVESDPEKENYFRLGKGKWQICFRGKPWLPERNYLGIRYIAHLIQRAHNDEPEIHVAELFYLVKGRPAVKNTELSKLTKEQLSETGFDLADLGNGLDLLTPKGKQRAISQVQQLSKQIEEAKKYEHTEEAHRLREQKEALEDYIGKAHGLSGRTRKASDPNETMRKAVSKAIAYALGRMGKEEGDELAIYLDGHLEKGLFCSFRKDPRISWKIMEK